ncbi:aminoglycoside phosphotransferase family protein [Brachybacterium fresconis]|uniref:Streptomycin 6-kinase n=1 Tax=Brachybacterium fresconis TaxID=173363 RepID=A0ABS4YES4_9MICO|nr:aminoglycoside phosphotransferase family protein [Brachybacterium fresconis]MBP2407291.1 streptomycin 6-kinase [Brachybacterium fresconis]
MTMRWLPTVDEAFRHRVLGQDDEACRAWLDSISGVCDDVARRWELEQAGPPSFGGTGIVLPVTVRGTRPAALKLLSPIADVHAEHRALSALHGHGTVEVHDADLERSALLLEFMDGPTLAEVSKRMRSLEAVSIAGRVAGRIAEVPAPRDAPQLAEGAGPWLEQLEEQHEAAHRLGIAVDGRTFAAAVGAVERLGRTRSGTLTHGDLSFENIMRPGDGTWIAIDPLFVAGPVEHEAHTVLRSLLPKIVGAPDPGAAMTEVVRAFCTAADADPALALDISYARFVASFYWESQHQGDPENIERLREATRYAGTLHRRHPPSD